MTNKSNSYGFRDGKRNLASAARDYEEEAISLISGLGDRISAASSSIGSRKTAAIVTGVSTDQLQRYIREENKPPLNFLLRLSLASQVDFNELVFGSIPTQPTARSQQGNADFVTIPVYDVRASMGHGAWGNEETKISDLAFRRDWIKAHGWDPDHLAVITAVGDSMEGVIEDGSPVLVDLSHPKISDAGIYVARFQDHLIIKRMQCDIDGTVYITSQNPGYREIVVTPEKVCDLHIVGRAVWSDRRL